MQRTKPKKRKHRSVSPADAHFPRLALAPTGVLFNRLPENCSDFFAVHQRGHAPQGYFAGLTVADFALNFRRVFGGVGRLHREDGLIIGIDEHGPQKLQRLPHIDRAKTGKFGAEYFGENARPQHTMNNGPFEGRLGREGIVEVEGVVVAGDAGKVNNIGLRKPEGVAVNRIGAKSWNHDELITKE